MAAHKLPPFHQRLPRGVLAAGLLGFLVIAAASLAFALIEPAIAFHHPQVPTHTPLASPTPSPTPVPVLPPVALLFHGNQHLREIALTFDDGPALDTPVILSILRQYRVRATFFMLGTWVQQFPAIARAVAADGHAIGDHTWNHPNLTQLSPSQVREQITSTHTIIQRVTGVSTALVRPPYGAYTHLVLNTIASLNCSTVLWNSDPRDWSRPGVSSIITYVLNNAQNGSIILLHDGGGDRSQTIAALPTIIEQLQARGFTFVTIPQMLLHLPPPTTPGSVNP